jgi:hypothetical protein
VDAFQFRPFASEQSLFLQGSMEYSDRFSNEMSPAQHLSQMTMPSTSLHKTVSLSPSRMSSQSQQQQHQIHHQQQSQQQPEAETVNVGNGNSGMLNVYSLDIGRVQSGEDTRTTLMIRNIPNKYTQKMLLDTMNEQFNGTYDFFYLPIDFKNKCNMGYAFINFVQPIHIVPFAQRFRNRKWDRFNSEKVCELAYARIQGTPALVQHFSNSSLLCEDKKCRPLLLVTEGTRKGEVLPFPSQEVAISTSI